MSILKYLGWAIIIDWLKGRRKRANGNYNSNLYGPHGFEYDERREMLEKKIYEANSRLDRMENELYGFDDNSEEYEDLEERVNELQDYIDAMEDEFDETDW